MKTCGNYSTFSVLSALNASKLQSGESKLASPLPNTLARPIFTAWTIPILVEDLSLLVSAQPTAATTCTSTSPFFSFYLSVSTSPHQPLSVHIFLEFWGRPLHTHNPLGQHHTFVIRLIFVYSLQSSSLSFIHLSPEPFVFCGSRTIERRSSRHTTKNISRQ